MSGIFGLIHFDDRPIQPDALRAMRDAMAYWGPDGGGLWHEGGAGLGQLLLYNTPESLHETMPLVGGGGNLVLVAGARLDNREELCDLFGIPHGERPVTPDGRLILRAYEKWGDDCPRRLIGDWAFAVWDRRERRLSLARDHFGNTALYYYCDSRSFVFASSLKGLQAVVPRQRPTELSLARLLVLFPVEGAASLHEPAVELPPAHCLTAGAGAVKARQYWRLQDAPDVRLPSDDAYLERFLELYGEAVRCRLRSHRAVGATLSSGLDSGSVTALAARELRGRGRMLTAFTSVPLYPEAAEALKGLVVDEWPLAHAAATFAGNVEHVAIRAEDVTPLAALERSLWLHDEPEYAASNFFWVIGLMAEARRRGLGALLTGQLGNGGVSWAGDGIRVLRPFLRGHWRRGWRTLAAWKASRRCSWPGALKSEIALPLRVWLKARGFRRGWLPGDSWAEYSPIHPDFARRLDVARRMQATGIDATFGRFTEPRAQREAQLITNAAIGGAFWHEAGAGYGLEVRDPTADIRLLEFCLGVPEEQWVDDEHDRRLIRRAMEGLLPPEVQWNTRRGRQGADLSYRLMADRDNVDAALASLAASQSARAVLDLCKMQRAWADVQRRVTPATHGRAATVLMRGLLTGLFLLTLEE